MHRNQCPSVSVVSGAPGEPHKGEAHASRSELCFALVWMLAKNVTMATTLIICSFTGLRISVCYVRSDSEVCAGTDLCRQYGCFSPASKGSAIPSQSKHWSGSRRVCRTCSTAPAPAACQEREGRHLESSGELRYCNLR